MNVEGLEQLFKINKNMLGPLGDWNKASTELLRKLTQQNLELIGENFSRVSDQFKRLSSVRKPEDLINLQKECINEDITASIENVQKIIHNTVEDIEALTKMFESVRETAVTTATKQEKVIKEKIKDKIDA